MKPYYLSALICLSACGSKDKTAAAPTSNCTQVAGTDSWQCTYADGMKCTFRMDGGKWTILGCSK